MDLVSDNCNNHISSPGMDKIFNEIEKKEEEKKLGSNDFNRFDLEFNKMAAKNQAINACSNILDN